MKNPVSFVLMRLRLTLRVWLPLIQVEFLLVLIQINVGLAFPPLRPPTV